MQRYIFTVPDTPEAQVLFNIISSSGYFKDIRKIDDIEADSEDFPEDVKKSIKKALEQVEQGLLTPHDEVMKTMKAKYLNK